MVHVSRHLKEELSLAKHKWIQMISMYIFIIYVCSMKGKYGSTDYIYIATGWTIYIIMSVLQFQSMLPFINHSYI